MIQPQVDFPSLSTPLGRRSAWPRTAARFVIIVCLAGLMPPVQISRAVEDHTFDIRAHGAVGDGQADDTDSINQAIDACAASGGGRVLVPPGRYLTGTIHLKSNVAMELAAGATIVGTSELDRYAHYNPPEGTPEARFRREWHRALILGVGVENVTIAGKGTIDGNKVFDPRGEERRRGPHTILFGDSQDITVRDASIVDSANYAVMLEYCHNVDVRNLKVTGGWDGVHFRGWQGRPCRDVTIVGCEFYTGDDAIAGRYWERTVIRDCIVNSSCNGIRLIGPAKDLIVHDCLFYGPGLYEHRTSDRHNMLAGIVLEPRAWDATEGELDEVLISDVTMRNVATAFQLTVKLGNRVGEVTVSRMSATGIYRSAASLESWTEEPIGRVTFRDIDLEYEGGAGVEDQDLPIQDPGAGVRKLPAWGFYARNVKNVILEDVRLRCVQPDLRCMAICESVEQLTFDNVRFTQAADAADPFVLKEVDDVRFRNMPESAEAAGER